MAKRKTADKTVGVEVDLQGTPTVDHPRWGVKGRPILVGDSCLHDGRKAVVKVVTPTVLTIKYLATSATAQAHVQECFRRIECVETLVQVERWSA